MATLTEPLIDFNAILTQFGDRLLNDIHANMESEGLGASGLAQSLTYDIDANRIVVTAAPYWDYAEHGRGPGKVPYNFQDILVTWMRKYGVKPKDGDEMRFANAIKWKTIKEGSSIWRGDRPARDFEGTAIDDNIGLLETLVADVTIKRMGELVPW